MLLFVLFVVSLAAGLLLSFGPAAAEGLMHLCGAIEPLSATMLVAVGVLIAAWCCVWLMRGFAAKGGWIYNICYAEGADPSLKHTCYRVRQVVHVAGFVLIGISFLMLVLIFANQLFAAAETAIGVWRSTNADALKALASVGHMSLAMAVAFLVSYIYHRYHPDYDDEVETEDENENNQQGNEQQTQ